jgi:hypothetical protein
MVLLLLLLHHRPDYGGSKHLWNVGKILRDYTVQPAQETVAWISNVITLVHSDAIIYEKRFRTSYDMLIQFKSNYSRSKVANWKTQTPHSRPDWNKAGFWSWQSSVQTPDNKGKLISAGNERSLV